MLLPTHIAVMTLPNATLFPQAMMPLHIFEPRYRQMLADALEGPRMFCVAMQRQDVVREAPVRVASVGLIRASVEHPNGTSHLILQGIERVSLGKCIRTRPYRVHRIAPLSSQSVPRSEVQPYLDTLREVTRSRIELGLPFVANHPANGKKKPSNQGLPLPTVSDMMKFLDTIHDPAQLTDVIASSLVFSPFLRQNLLEITDVQERLHSLITSLSLEIDQLKNPGSNPEAA
jgi:ATP-dependent Lon protease